MTTHKINREKIMKSIATAFILLLSLNATARERTKICQVYYHHDIFSRYLELIIEKTDSQGLLLWMDTPTPYGIRPYGYDIKKISCTSSHSLEVEAKATGNQQQVIFNSKAENTAGKLAYLSELGERQAEITLECTPTEIQKFCN
jgi:hypothetical protein